MQRVRGTGRDVCSNQHFILIVSSIVHGVKFVGVLRSLLWIDISRLSAKISVRLQNLSEVISWAFALRGLMAYLENQGILKNDLLKTMQDDYVNGYPSPIFKI